MTTSPERAGILVASRALKTALKEGVIVGGIELDTEGSYYIQYEPSNGAIILQINGETLLGVTHIELGKPCGVLIIHTNQELGKYDYFPEEIISVTITR